MKPDPEKKSRPTKHFHPRRLARKVAKKNMEKEGYRKVNRNFSTRKGDKKGIFPNWHDYVY